MKDFMKDELVIQGPRQRDPLIQQGTAGVVEGDVEIAPVIRDIAPRRA